MVSPPHTEAKPHGCNAPRCNDEFRPSKDTTWSIDRDSRGCSQRCNKRHVEPRYIRLCVEYMSVDSLMRRNMLPMLRIATTATELLTAAGKQQRVLLHRIKQQPQPTRYSKVMALVAHRGGDKRTAILQVGQNQPMCLGSAAGCVSVCQSHTRARLPLSPDQKY